MWILFLLPTFAVLAVQRDWIESDKTRILLMGFLPLVLFLGVGLAALFDRKKLTVNLIIIGCAAAGLFAVSFLAARIGGTPDEGLYQRKPFYQHETPATITLYRKQFGGLNLMPDWRRLMFKTRLARKHAEESFTAWTLFSESGSAGSSGNRLIEFWFPPKSIPPPQERGFPPTFVNLQIDFDKLVTDMGNAARIVGDSEELLADFEKKNDLLDIYYKACRVSWQPNPLPVALLTGKPEYTVLGELVIDLNAFIGYGQDEYGFERVNMINMWVNEKTRPFGLRGAMTALPQRNDAPTIALRIPKDATVVIRDWIVDATQGVPHRIDSWTIVIGDDGLPKTAFHPLEPESYL